MSDQPQAEGSIAGRRETAVDSASDAIDPSACGRRCMPKVALGRPQDDGFSALARMHSRSPKPVSDGRTSAVLCCSAALRESFLLGRRNGEGGGSARGAAPLLRPDGPRQFVAVDSVVPYRVLIRAAKAPARIRCASDDGCTPSNEISEP